MLFLIHLLCSLAVGGLWYGAGYWRPRSQVQFLQILWRGCRGALLAVAICTFIAALVSHSGLVLVQADQPTLFFVFFSIGFSLIGIPVGFLCAIARESRAALREQEREEGSL